LVSNTCLRQSLLSLGPLAGSVGDLAGSSDVNGVWSVRTAHGVTDTVDAEELGVSRIYIHLSCQVVLLIHRYPPNLLSLKDMIMNPRKGHFHPHLRVCPSTMNLDYLYNPHAPTRRGILLRILLLLFNMRVAARSLFMKELLANLLPGPKSGSPPSVPKMSPI